MNKIKAFFKNNWIDIFKPVIVLFAICTLIPLALAGTNMLTAKRIAKLTELNNKKAMQTLVKADNYAEKTYENAKGEEIVYYCAEKDGKVAAMIFITSGKGYGGDVSVMTAVGNEGILAVDVLDVSNETPGLGQNTEKESFYSQYAGKNDKVTVVKNGADGAKNEINAVTGATISSKAVTLAVNTALGYYDEISGKAGEAE